MAQQIVPQVDVGSLSLQGLSRFSQMLSTLSADNVLPMAMIQMENLGALFPTNGEHAAKVPDLLQRYSSIRIDRLSLAIGWRKGDAASLMATSAGGQAVSLLCVCLCSLLTPADTGEVLFQLSQTFLPRNEAISSVSQLANVAALLGGKLDILGFGNLLAHQVMRVNSAYEQLSIPFPNDFLEQITSESMFELLYSISQALREETALVRISGSCGMGHVLGVVLMLFPQDVVVTVENVVIHEGLRRSLLLEIVSHEEYNGMLKVQVETTLDTATSGPLLQNLVKIGHGHDPSLYRFTWSGWIAHYLELEFLSVGLVCTQDLLLACCELLVLIPAFVNAQSFPASDFPRKGLIALLGPAPNERMRQICLSTYQVQPRMVLKSLPTAYKDLVSVFRMLASRIQCSCGREHSIIDLSKAWGSNYSWHRASIFCHFYRILAAIGNALNMGLCCFFVEAGPNATIRGSYPASFTHQEFLATDAICRAILPGDAFRDEWAIPNCDTLHESILTCFSGYHSPHSLASSSNSSTIYPVLLEKMQIDSSKRASYLLLEGRLFFNDRYHRRIESAKAPSTRVMGEKFLSDPKNEVFPSSVGEHSHILLTLKERFSWLEIRTSVRVSGVNLDLDLFAILISCYGLNMPEPCNHPVSDPLVPELQDLVRTTSVASPYAPGWISIVQAQHNPTAQFLACEHVPTLWLKDCCLSCAVRQAKNEGFKMIIVS